LLKTDKVVIVDKKAAYLFTCRRDVLMDGVVERNEECIRGDLVLVHDEAGMLVGMGKITSKFNKNSYNKVYVKNLVDIGDYLRRER
jgi:ribosome biogenesis protein Nip4